jgi:hypothetical protein
VTLRGGKAPDYWASFYRGEVLQLLNATLQDPQSATSDTTVATIVLLFGYDVSILPSTLFCFTRCLHNSQVLFGLHKAYEEHMKGLDRIVALRGGADKLGLNRLLEKQVKWYKLTF